jgi:hypothetical protein
MSKASVITKVLPTPDFSKFHSHASFGMFGYTIKVLSTRELERGTSFLIANHLSSIQSIIEQARYMIALAHPEISGKVAEAVFKKASLNSTEYNQEKFLNSAIVFTNSLIDYLQILIVLLYTDSSSIRSEIKESDIKSHMKNKGIQTNEWYLSLFSLMQKGFKDFYNQAKENKVIPSEIMNAYSQVIKDHHKFQSKFQANALKHYGATAFNRTDPANILGANFINFSLDSFYKDDIRGGSIGARSNNLDFESTLNGVAEELNRIIEFTELLISQIEYEEKQ